MSFRKRNIGISDGRRPSPSNSQVPTRNVTVPGVRPSAIDGKPVTSTGSASFDGLFAGHGGLPTGTSVLVEESGTTDYAGALLRFYAAEGLMQGHYVHVVGLPESWGRELPGLTSESKSARDTTQSEKMKIAWRYERLGQHATDVAARADAEFLGSRDSATKDEPPQGLLRVHKLPLLHELGSGSPLADTDWTFTLSRRKFTIKPFDLPPIEGDTEAQKEASVNDKPKKADMDF
ncbi:Elongator subunit elp4 [Lithohypha guttulata]|uniref:Elongator complex protein 4 n=1 Tax=Lithohypha guttulata TaxID=1690604 RepID=A0AAN7YGV5_9EURO|nr:Elongator subunit elp4 [Lithohypha guttulata]